MDASTKRNSSSRKLGATKGAQLQSPSPAKLNSQKTPNTVLVSSKASSSASLLDSSVTFDKPILESTSSPSGSQLNLREKQLRSSSPSPAYLNAAPKRTLSSVELPDAYRDRPSDPLAKKRELRDTMERVQQMILDFDQQQKKSIVEDVALEFEQEEMSSSAFSSFSEGSRSFSGSATDVRASVQLEARNSSMVIKHVKTRTNRLLQDGLDKTLGTRTNLLTEVSNWMADHTVDDLFLGDSAFVSHEKSNSRAQGGPRADITYADEDENIMDPMEVMTVHMEHTRKTVERLHSEFLEARTIAQQMMDMLAPLKHDRDDVERRFRMQMERIQQEIAALRSKLEQSSESISYLRNENEEKVKTISKLESMIDRQQAIIERLKGIELERNNDPYGKDRVEKLTTKLQDLLNKFMRLQKQYDDATRRNRELLQEVRMARGQQGVHEEDTGSQGASEQQEHMSMYLDEVHARSDPLVQQMLVKARREALDDMDAAHSKELQHARDTVRAECQAALDEMTRKYQSFVESNSKMRQEFDAMSAKVSVLQNDNKKLSKQCKHAESLKQQIASVQKELDVAKAQVALGIASSGAPKESKTKINDDDDEIQELSKEDTKKLHQVIAQGDKQIKQLTELLEQQITASKELKHKIKFLEGHLEATLIKLETARQGRDNAQATASNAAAAATAAAATLVKIQEEQKQAALQRAAEQEEQRRAKAAGLAASKTAQSPAAASRAAGPNAPTRRQSLTANSLDPSAMAAAAASTKSNTVGPRATVSQERPISPLASSVGDQTRPVSRDSMLGSTEAPASSTHSSGIAGQSQPDTVQQQPTTQIRQRSSQQQQTKPPPSPSSASSTSSSNTLSADNRTGSMSSMANSRKQSPRPDQLPRSQPAGTSSSSSSSAAALNVQSPNTSRASPSTATAQSVASTDALQQSLRSSPQPAKLSPTSASQQESKIKNNSHSQAPKPSVNQQPTAATPSSATAKAKSVSPQSSQSAAPSGEARKSPTSLVTSAQSVAASSAKQAANVGVTPWEESGALPSPPSRPTPSGQSLGAEQQNQNSTGAKTPSETGHSTSQRSDAQLSASRPVGEVLKVAPVAQPVQQNAISSLHVQSKEQQHAIGDHDEAVSENRQSQRRNSQSDRMGDQDAWSISSAADDGRVQNVDMDADEEEPIVSSYRVAADEPNATPRTAKNSPSEQDRQDKQREEVEQDEQEAPVGEEVQAGFTSERIEINVSSVSARALAPASTRGSEDADSDDGEVVHGYSDSEDDDNASSGPSIKQETNAEEEATGESREQRSVPVKRTSAALAKFRMAARLAVAHAAARKRINVLEEAEKRNNALSNLIQRFSSMQNDNSDNEDGDADSDTDKPSSNGFNYRVGEEAGGFSNHTRLGSGSASGAGMAHGQDGTDDDVPGADLQRGGQRKNLHVEFAFEDDKPNAVDRTMIDPVVETLSGRSSASRQSELSSLRELLAVTHDDAALAAVNKFAAEDMRLQREQVEAQMKKMSHLAKLRKIHQELFSLDPRSPEYQLLLRMEEQHRLAMQRWEEKRNSILKERQKHLELVLKAVSRLDDGSALPPGIVAHLGQVKTRVQNEAQKLSEEARKMQSMDEAQWQLLLLQAHGGRAQHSGGGDGVHMVLEQLTGISGHTLLAPRANSKLGVRSPPATHRNESEMQAAAPTAHKGRASPSGKLPPSPGAKPAVESQKQRSSKSGSGSGSQAASPGMNVSGTDHPHGSASASGSHVATQLRLPSI